MTDREQEQKFEKENDIRRKYFHRGGRLSLGLITLFALSNFGNFYYQGERLTKKRQIIEARSNNMSQLEEVNREFLVYTVGGAFTLAGLTLVGANYIGKRNRRKMEEELGRMEDD